ncbi:anthrone oxygenase family protein [Allosphingosinicella deserti]|uniref:DUF1772 domain-containing protein n=1 Tax=Allosphingosinicella deserti TaxID=2116704 RepID=A0A2P7QH74_9SPHN|nr:anthrone oxygenase family protein [Sphingomonas deserti]PSJ37315.1 hypothetical protein C7I55_22625 [Sphingomonas deserti]
MSVFEILLAAGALGCGLMAGVYFAFSAFIMAALDRVGKSEAIAAMNAINIGIVRSAFMPLFVGTTLVSLAVGAASLIAWPESGRANALLGATIYFGGMFVVTLICNVPLNEALARSRDQGDSTNSAWNVYMARWTRWNHVRTAASAIAAAVFLTELILRK